MKQLIYDLYNGATSELDKIPKGKLTLTVRIALEKALVKLEDMKRVMGYCDIKPTN